MCVYLSALERTVTLVGKGKMDDNMSYSILILITGCRYWDANNNKFSTEGAFVSIV